MTAPDEMGLDSGGMYEAIRGFPNQLAEGRQLASRVDPNLSVSAANVVVITGMGGSAIGADLLRALCIASSQVPVHVVRGYSLPGFVNASTIVIASSYSGETEETLVALDDALERNAQVVCIATGGELEQRAGRHGLTFYKIPGGLQPRAAVGYSLATLLTLAERIGLLSLGPEAWEEAGSLLQGYSDALADDSENKAREIATALDGKLPFVYSGSDLLEPVATRWCCQFAENAKILSHANRFPELNHNEIMGWEEDAGFHERIGVVVLRDRLDHPRVQRRMDLTRELLTDRAGCWLEVDSRGASALARMLTLVHLGDWVSFYAALLRGVDPTPIDLISTLKSGL